jgi:hypothetical protein
MQQLSWLDKWYNPGHTVSSFYVFVADEIASLNTTGNYTYKMKVVFNSYQCT